MKKGFTPLNTEGSGLKKAKNLIGFTSLNIKIKDSGSKARNLTGFTLIELLVVIAIISVIATLATVALNATRAKSRDAKRVSDIKQIQTALEMYKNDSNNYPLAVTSGNSLVYSTQTYMKTVPVAPGKPDGACTTDVYTYTYYSATGIYQITYCLGGIINTIGPGNAKATPGNIFTAVFACGDSITGKGSDTQVYGTVTATNGKCWLNRNLGATQVASSATDTAAYGYSFQWGRDMDGHQSRTSGTTTTLSATDTPGHANFITSFSGNWRSSQNVSLWQGVSGINNPCPSGFRVPTETELNAEYASWSSQDSTGAFASPLKWTVIGYRSGGNGTFYDAGSSGYYWSSSVNGSASRYLNSNGGVSDGNRTNGLGIRCIQD